MNSINTISNNTKFNTAFKTILWSGFLSGLLDALAGIIVYYLWLDYNPLQVVEYIASGIYGSSAYEGGVLVLLVGLFFHFVVAYVVATLYFFAYPKIKLLRDYKIASGIIYGLGVWLVMNLIVIPFTNVPSEPFDAVLSILGMIWHMMLVGLPIAIITSKYYDTK
jgi:hypothetical protein